MYTVHPYYGQALPKAHLLCSHAGIQDTQVLHHGLRLMVWVPAPLHPCVTSTPRVTNSAHLHAASTHRIEL
jgi:hypothetical protein